MHDAGPDASPVLSLLLRCLRVPAADGQVVGQAEVVATGEKVTIRDVDDLATIVRRLAATDSGAGAMSPEGEPGRPRLPD